MVLQNCNIYPQLLMPNQFNTITAQGRTDPNQNTGISIHKCAIKPASDLASSIGKTKTESDGNFALDTLYYAKYDNKGPGSNTASRVQWGSYHRDISESEADGFTVSKFIDGEC
ncbi:pectin methylesterase family protein [Hibiscus syriacus]|uniref:Pectin methylesterase family protein n=1 Tax=Hibiscus syriacus TaxID=106335 RepID=A0A6A2XQ83_HIBSY|nr:pectin methylesterase family protein [Hibiscus syriacus]